MSDVAIPIDQLQDERLSRQTMNGAKENSRAAIDRLQCLILESQHLGLCIDRLLIQRTHQPQWASMVTEMTEVEL